MPWSLSTATPPTTFTNPDRSTRWRRTSLIYVAGHRGLVGSAICRSLRQQGFDRLLLRTHAELDLTDAVAVQRFFAQERPAHVFLAAAKVGESARTIPIRRSLSGKISRSTDQHHSRELPLRGRSSALPRIELHLPQTLSAAHPGRISANWSAQGDQSAVCSREDRRHRDVLVLQPAIWDPLSCRDADEPLRTRRQL